MTNFFRWIFWFVCMVLRFALIVIGTGLVLPVVLHFWFSTDPTVNLLVNAAIVMIHIGIDTPRTAGMNYLEKYWENCIRNPTPYLRGIFKQPIPEEHPNPDKLVRGDRASMFRASRVMASGPYIEYWKLEKRDNKKRPYWETRIGWKFVDDEETFWPTIQFGPRR